MDKRKIRQYALQKVLGMQIGFYDWNSKFYNNDSEVYINNVKFTLTEEQVRTWAEMNGADILKEIEDNRVELPISFNVYEKISRNTRDQSVLKTLGHFDQRTKSWYADNKKNASILQRGIIDKYLEDDNFNKSTTKDVCINTYFGEKGDFVGDISVMRRPDGSTYEVCL